MRSSIACTRCRRSKVKCVNNGVGTTCRSCENAGRECSYPSPVAGATRRPESLGGKGDDHHQHHHARFDGGGGSSDRRPRPRKTVHAFPGASATAPRESPRPLLDALDPKILTATVWQELFDVFQVHYSADLPFLHPPSFLGPLRQAAMRVATSTSTDGGDAARPPGSPEFLMAFLALTARFHPKLVAHHSPAASSRASNPLIASEYYAAAAHERMASMWADASLNDIEHTQALLMLGLHEWGMCRGAKAWVLVGMAIRAAQAMGLQYEVDLDDEPLSRSLALDVDLDRGLTGSDDTKRFGSIPSIGLDQDDFMRQEIRRRTFWSCYIMDRYLSSGKYRPKMLYAHELRIQLPASERSFLFAEKVRTLMLGEENNQAPCRSQVQHQRRASVIRGGLLTGDSRASAVGLDDPYGPEREEDKGRLESGAEEGLVSRYIKVLEIYGRVVKWSCAGGRRTEEHPPWDPRSAWSKLRQECSDFKSSLPRQHTLTPQNTQAHVSLKASTPYLLMHSVFSLCQVILHREFLPFLPMRCSRPEGPLDPPTFSPSAYNVPTGFWEESARECVRSARELIDLVRSCQEWGQLVETPIVGFAIYSVCLIGVYCINFPWMDPDGYMCTRQLADGPKAVPSAGFEAAKRSLEMIGQMRPRLHMAIGWFRTITYTHRYLRRLKSEYAKTTHYSEATSNGRLSPASSTRGLSMRDGSIGGGHEELKLIERVLREYGHRDEEDVDMPDAARGSDPQGFDGRVDDSHSAASLKSEEDGADAPAERTNSNSAPWNAINTAATPASTPASDHRPSTSTTSSGPFRSYDGYATAPPVVQQAPPTPQHTQPAAGLQYSQHPITNFRPSQPPTGPPDAHEQPLPSVMGLSSPNSLGRPSPSHVLPPYPSGNGTSHSAPPINTAPTNGLSHPSSAHSLPPLPSISSIRPDAHSHWDTTQHERWLESLDTRFSADDVAAFVDGAELADWVGRATTRGVNAGWLSAVWAEGR